MLGSGIVIICLGLPAFVLGVHLKKAQAALDGKKKKKQQQSKQSKKSKKHKKQTDEPKPAESYTSLIWGGLALTLLGAGLIAGSFFK